MAKSGAADLVIVLSDAELEKHDVTPLDFYTTVVEQCGTTKVYCIFISLVLSEGRDIVEQLPAGQGYTCREPVEFPAVFQEILLAHYQKPPE
jgi:hypothetical protein